MGNGGSFDEAMPVRQLTRIFKDYVNRLGTVWVSGQVVQLKRKAQGLNYLTLRDAVEDSSITVAIESFVLLAAGPLDDGMEVTACLKPDFWVRNGTTVFSCSDIRPSGEGRLLAEIHKRIRLLQAEGLFDAALKKPLPLLPRRIGLITGSGSAAERDVLRIAHERWPAAEFEIRYTLVQGPTAAGQIMAALAELDAIAEVEVIIIARGGGSFEDLLPFSDEGLVRAVFKARTPVVSAIGHEVDTPILDLVADVRAATPTDAAKRVVPDIAEERRVIGTAVSRVRNAIGQRLDQERQRLAALRSRPVLRDPMGPVLLHEERLATLRRRLRSTIDRQVHQEELALGHQLCRIRSMSPQATLQRGYAVLLTADNASVTSVTATVPGQAVTARLVDGQMGLLVTRVQPDHPAVVTTTGDLTVRRNQGKDQL